MSRANRFRGDGGIYHVTHRCHNKAHLLKCARDRDAYRSMLWRQLQEFQVVTLDYCLTTNHVHLLLDAEEREEIGRLMQVVEGQFARAYNWRKERQNAFWGDNYHATLIEGGDYLWRCLCYIELNMVRAGVVAHPREWPWVGYHEIMGTRRRCRLIDLDRLCWRVRASSIEDLKLNMNASLAQAIARRQLKREPLWTESLAVGSKDFVEKAQPLAAARLETNLVQTSPDLWLLKEEGVLWGKNEAQKMPLTP